MQGGFVMFLEAANNNGKKYIRLVESVRVTKDDGSRVTRKRTIKNIGPLSRFTDGSSDYFDKLKKSFAAGNPIIPELLPYVKKDIPLEKYTFQFTEGSPECIGHPKLYSHCLIERILEDLGVIKVVNSYKCFSKIEYDLLGYIRLMIYGRILNPASKISTVRQNGNYYEPITKDTYEYHIYDALDFIYDHKKQLFNRINSAIVRKFNRKSNLIYYDVTNFYFEIDEPDDDILDDDTIVEKGLRKMGVSKENRKQPIVQMGLFMDEAGIPISYEIFPGNTLDHLTVKSALRKSVDNMDFNRFIFVGDRGMCTYKNLLHILSLGNGYVVSKSIKKSKNEEKDWIFDDSDYIKESDNFKYKSKTLSKYVKDGNGKNVKISEKVVVYWDKKFYEKELAENKSFLEFLQRLIESPENFRITASQSKNIRQFLKEEYLNTETGEILKAANLKTYIDTEKVKEYKRHMGYYQIVTSELKMSEKEVIDIYHGLTRIEDQFKVMKGDLNTRPIYVNTPEHIEAHLAICTIALIVLRIIQKKLVDTGVAKSDKEKYWSYGMSAERIQEALNKWTVDMLPNELYRFNNIDDKDLKQILDAFNIEIPMKLFRRQELKQIKTNIKISN